MKPQNVLEHPDFWEQTSTLSNKTGREEINFAEKFKSMKKKEIMYFIRGSLMNKGKRLRFNMSGNVPHNQKVLNTFAYLGIYDNTDFFCLKFHKGTGSLLIKYSNNNVYYSSENDFSGKSTTEIIYYIFLMTILKDK
tara:strand:+ start:10778 stop:11188 length:411 start_codon:yes stop_codon:yes gene_type:complete